MKRNEQKLVSPETRGKIAALRVSPDEKNALTEIIAKPTSYIPNKHFAHSSYMNLIMSQSVSVPPDSPMSTADEQALFLQMNYARYKLCQIRQRLLRQSHWHKKDVQQLLLWYNLQLNYRSRIVTCNIGLVLSMAQRVDYPGVEFTDLVSEGSLALLRASEKFDCDRGFKFSTYACRAIFKGFSRAAKQQYRYHSRFPAQLDVAMEQDNREQQLHDEFIGDLVDEFRVIFYDNLADLSDIELAVMKMRFSIGSNQYEPVTLKCAGEKLGLTKERIRQIQNKALKKLRIVVEERLAIA